MLCSERRTFHEMKIDSIYLVGTDFDWRNHDDEKR